MFITEDIKKIKFNLGERVTLAKRIIRQSYKPHWSKPREGTIVGDYPRYVAIAFKSENGTYYIKAFLKVDILLENIRIHIISQK